jgi:hypothetical protein
MSKRPLLFSAICLCLAACASTSNPPGPEQQYWIVQDQQKDLHPANKPRVTYLPITTGGVTNNAVVTVPTTEYIPVQESF